MPQPRRSRFATTTMRGLMTATTSKTPQTSAEHVAARLTTTTTTTAMTATTTMVIIWTIPTSAATLTRMTLLRLRVLFASSTGCLASWRGDLTTDAMTTGAHSAKRCGSTKLTSLMTTHCGGLT